MTALNDYEHGFIIFPNGRYRAMPKMERRDGTFTLAQLQLAVAGYTADEGRVDAKEYAMVQQVFPDAQRLPPWLSNVDYSSVFDTMDFLVDEEGLLKQLQPNVIATSMMGQMIVGPLVSIPKETWA